MRFITGDECGFLKECIPEKAAVKDQTSNVVKPNAEPAKPTEDGIRRISNSGSSADRTNGVVGLAWTQPTDDEQFAALRLNGTVELWQRSQTEERDFGGYLQVTELKNVFDDSTDSEIHPSTYPLGLASFSANNKNQLCACNAEGTVVILNPTRQESVVQRFSVFKQTTTAPTTKIVPSNEKAAIATAFALDTVHHRVAVGGRDRETVLFDTETAKLVWKAKNLAPDPQTLLQPLVWPTALTFMDCSLGPNMMAAGSAHCQVRIYDVRAEATQRRPVCWTPIGLLDHRVTTLCQLTDNYLVAGDAAGYLHTLDLRKLGRPVKTDSSVQTVGRYVGPAGSVRGLAKHGSQSRMACVGLDRMLRVYNTDKRKQVCSMYLKQRLNCVLVGQDSVWVDEEAEEEEDVMLDDEGRNQKDVVQDYLGSSDEEEGDAEDGGDASVREDIDQAPEEDEEASESASEDSESSVESVDDDEDEESEEVDTPVVPPPKKKRR